MPFGKAAIAALLLAMSTAATTAATFDFVGGAGESAPSHSATTGGITLTASGVRCDPDCGSGHAAELQMWDSHTNWYWTGTHGWFQVQEGGGLGLHAFNGDSHQVDGIGLNEMVVLAFDHEVSLTRLTFSHIHEPFDDFALWRNDGGTWTRLIDSATIVDADGAFGSSGRYDFGQSYVGSAFGIATTDWTDGWKLAGVSAERALSNPDPVPLPAGAALLLVALGALGLMRRKRLPTPPIGLGASTSLRA